MKDDDDLLGPSSDPNERIQGLNCIADRKDEASKVLDVVVRTDKDRRVRRHTMSIVVTRWENHVGDWYQHQRTVAWVIANGSEKASGLAAGAFGRFGDNPQMRVTIGRQWFKSSDLPTQVHENAPRAWASPRE